MVPLECDAELESISAGMGRVVMTWVASLEKKVTSRWDVLAACWCSRSSCTYRAQDLSPAHDLVLVHARDIVEVEDELGEQLLVVADPGDDGRDVVGRGLGRALRLLGRGLGLACRLEFAREGRLRGSGAADEAVAAGLGVVDLDDVLLLRRLPVEDIALLAGVRALALPTDGSWAQRRVGGIAQRGQRHAAVRHGGSNVRRGRDGEGGHAWMGGGGRGRGRGLAEW
jgi:hypothetical protein